MAQNNIIENQDVLQNIIRWMIKNQMLSGFYFQRYFILNGMEDKCEAHWFHLWVKVGKSRGINFRKPFLTYFLTIHLTMCYSLKRTKFLHEKGLLNVLGLVKNYTRKCSMLNIVCIFSNTINVRFCVNICFCTKNKNKNILW